MNPNQIQEVQIPLITPTIVEPPPVTAEDIKLDPVLESIINASTIVIKSVPLRALLLDQNGEPYVAYQSTDGKPKVGGVRSRDVRNYIRYIIYQLSGEVLTENGVKEYADQIEAHCYLEGTSVELFIRTARDGAHLLVDGINTVYRVTAERWWADDDFKPVFKRPQGMLPLAAPVKGGDPRKFLDFINIKEPDDRLLLLVYLVASFIPDIPHPPLIIYGPQGSSKSTLLRFLVELIDPACAVELPFRNERDFMLAAGQRWVVGLDNVSFIHDSVSDIFCKLVTGASYTARMLYTNEDLLIRNFRRVLIINGINISVEKSDLMDRCILMRTDRISSDQRKDEAALKMGFDHYRGEILGGCFDALSRALEIYPTVKLSTKQRMADFTIWGCAIAEGLGFNREDFLRAYANNIEQQHIEALDASPVAALITEYFRQNKITVLAGTPSYVFRELKRVAEAAGIDERQLPRTPRSFGKRLQEACSNLEAHGYHIDRTRNKDRQIRIYPPKKSDPPSSPSLPPLHSGGVPTGNGPSGEIK